MSSFNYRAFSICKVRYECDLFCRGCKYQNTNDCKNMINALQEEAERFNARSRQNNIKRIPDISGKA